MRDNDYLYFSGHLVMSQVGPKYEELGISSEGII